MIRKKIILFAPIVFFIFFTSCVQEVKKTSAVTNNSKVVKDSKFKTPVLGWHRVKEGFKVYDYKVLNMLAYFSYKVNPKTGREVENIDWKSDPILDSAEVNNCSIYLTVTNFGYSKNKEFLNNEAGCDTLINRLSNMLMIRQSEGICIDFEEVHKEESDLYNSFIIKLSKELKKNNKKLIVVLPISYDENVVNPRELNDYVDYFIMMGYACYHLGSSHAGPISPLRSGETWEPYNLSDNVSNYLSHSFLASQFMVALPLYGTVWETESKEINSRSKKGIKELTYNKIRSKFKNQEILTDSISQSSFYSYEENGKFMQCWFESEQNLELKIKFLLKEKSIAGIGFWAMGYSDKNPEMWSMVKENI